MDTVYSRNALVLLAIVAGVCVSVVIDDFYHLFHCDHFLAQKFLAHFAQGLAAVTADSFLFGKLKDDVLRRKLLDFILKGSLWLALVFGNYDRFLVWFGCLWILLCLSFIEYAELVGRNILLLLA
jgi:hypothetical protein